MVKKYHSQLQRKLLGKLFICPSFDNISVAFLPREKYFHLVSFGISSDVVFKPGCLQKITKSLETCTKPAR